MAYKIKMNKKDFFLKLITVFFIIIFLEFCPPSGKDNFNWYLFLLSIVFLLYSLLKGDYTIIGLILPIGNGITRFSNIPYPTVSFLISCIILGLIFNNKKMIKLKSINLVPFYFFIIFLISSVRHIFSLIYPQTVFVVNRIGYLNTEIIYHIVGYQLFVLFISIFLFYTISFFYDDEKIKNIFVFFAVGIIISSVVGILQFFEVLKGKFGYIIEYEKRVNGLFSNFNSFSLSLALLLPMFLFYFSKVEKIYLKVLFLVSFMLGILNLFLTGTRSGIICFFLTLIFVFIYLVIRKNIKSIHIFFILFFFVSVVLFVKFFKNYYPVKRVVESINTATFFDNIKTSRSIFWQAGIKLWKQNIFVGNGIKSFYKEFPNITQQWFSDNACNTYINYLSEIGVFGISVFFVVIFYIIYSFFKSFITQNTYCVFLTAVLISFLVVSFFGHHFDAEEVSLIFWFYLAIVLNGIKINWDKYVNKILFSLTTIFCVLNIISTVKEIKEIDIFKYRNYAGLYHPENIFGKTAQWSEKKVFIKLENYKNKNLVLEVNPADIDNQNIKIFLNEKEYRTVNLKKYSWTEIKIPITEDKLIVKIVPQYTFCPAGKLRYLFPFHGKDYRTLGVALRFYIS